jgi:dephospho-CoA kinase
MIILGLTGGICSGKTLISNWFKEKDCVVFNADKIVKDLYTSNQNIIIKIIQEFGEQVKKSNNELNTQKISDIVFNNKDKLLKLETIVHPEVKNKIISEIKKIDTNNIVIIDAPLLLEAGFDDIVDKIIVVSCSEQEQIKRCAKRDNFSIDKIKKIINNQLPLKEKLKKADFIIDNTEIQTKTRRQFEDLWQTIVTMNKKKI